MGFIVPTVVLPETGQVFNNAYASVTSNKIAIEKYVNSPNFYVSYTFHIWVDLDARIANKQPVASLTYSFTLYPHQLINNIYTMVYNDIKQRHPEYIEHL